MSFVRSSQILATLTLVLSLCAHTSYADDVVATDDGQGGGQTGSSAVMAAVNFCKQVNKIQSLMMSFQVAQWPVAGLPGVVQGLSMRTSPIIDYCGYVLALENLNTTDAIFYAAGELNSLTGNKFDEQINFAKKTWDLSNSIYDFENGKGRPGTLMSRSTIKALGSYADDVCRMSGSVDPNDCKTGALVSDTFSTAKDTYDFASLAGKRAVLNESMRCPNPRSSVDYSKKYQTELAPLERQVYYLRMDRDFYYTKIRVMGGRMYMNLSACRKGLASYAPEIPFSCGGGTPRAFFKDLENLRENGTIFKPAYRTIPDPRYGGGAANTLEVQQFTTASNGRIFKEFSNHHAEVWTEYFANEFLNADKRQVMIDRLKERTAITNANTADSDRPELRERIGLLNPEERMDREFRDIAGECTPGRLMRDVDPNNANYRVIKEDRVTKCQQAVKMNQSTASNLFAYYIKKFEAANQNYKTIQAKAWSKEAELTGQNKVFDPNKPGMENMGSEPQCKDKITVAEMDSIKAKMQNIQAQIQEKLAKNELQKQQEEITGKRAAEEAYQERQAKAAAAERAAQEKKEAIDSTPPVVLAPVVVEY